MKILVTSFSRTGQTTRIAREIARQCDAHLDVVQVPFQEDSWLAPWRYQWQTLVRAEPPIQRPGRNPGNYDLVVVGVPISPVGPAPPIRSYLRQYASRIRQIAFFCAEGSGVDERGFAELGRLYGKPPVATFTVARKSLPTMASRKQLIDFVDSIRAGPG